MKNYIKSKSLTLEVTNACGCHCMVCPREKRTTPIKMMEFNLFKKILDQGIDAGIDVLSVCGFGEALLDPGLYEKLCYVKANYPYVKTYISTTGYCLDDYAFEKIVPLLDEIKISHFSDDEKTFKKLHGEKVDYLATMAALERLCDMPADTRPYLNFLFVLTEINKEEMKRWIERWEKQVDELMVWKPHNWGGQWPETELHTADELHTCGRPFHGDLYIHSNGLVSPCCFDFDCKMVVGDLNKQTLEEVYFGKEMEWLRDIHKNNLYIGSGMLCENCDQTRNREGALVYSTNKERRVGVITSSRLERMNNVLEASEWVAR